MDDFNEYYYDYNDHNICDYDDHEVSGLLTDDEWFLEYEDEQIWLEVKAKFEKYLDDLMEADSYD